MTYTDLIAEIEQGKIKVPQFQRNFVWSKEKSAKLLDSIVKGYPIGTFIIWKTKEQLKTIRNIGDMNLPVSLNGDYVDYVIDGQQRITSLYASIKGTKVKRETIEEDFNEIFVDLTVSEDEPIIITDITDRDKYTYIRLKDLLKGGIAFLAKYPKPILQKLETYKTRFETYPFATIIIKESPISVATEIFTRINIGGKPLSVFEIMVAKTFDVDLDFDLAEKCEIFIEKLREIDYETISESTILQTISVLLTKDCTKKVILNLDKFEFIKMWPKAIDAIEMTLDYFRSYFRIPVSKLLPYNGLIVPFAYFFYHNKNKPTGEKRKLLTDFFWRISLSGRYSFSLEAKIGQDILRIDKILKNIKPEYDYAIDIKPSFIEENGWFSVGRSYIKALLCILCYHQPKSFIDNSIVHVSNDWLKQANSKNYHHFFPKAYLKKQEEPEFYINHILNITIVDDFLNKSKIKNKKPSIYMKEFKQKNKQIRETMKTHLINLETFGIWENDYDKFFKKRAQFFNRELKKRLITRTIDEKGQMVNNDDYEEDERSA